MKKIVFVLGMVMALSLMSVASAATLAELQASLVALQAQIAAMGGTTAAVSSSVPTITKSLTIGSKGDEVSDLQKYLENEGLLVMPAGVDYGYFGALTKKAVVEWQKANDVSPASGYFGPISRAALEALAAAAPAPVTPGPVTPTPGVTTNTEGSLTASTNSSVASSIAIKKGESKEVFAFDVKASGGDVKINRIYVNFTGATPRAWLYASKMEVKDGSTVLASKDLSSSAFDEISSGNNYRLTLDNINLVVTKDASKKTLKLVLYTIAGTDKTATELKVNLSDSNAIRYVDGTGLSQTTNVDAVRTITTTVSTSGDVAPSISSNTPKERFLGISDTGTTENVTMMVFDLKATNRDVEVDNLAFHLNTVSDTAANIFKKVEVRDGDTVLGSGTISGATSTFTDLNIKLTKDVKKTLTLVAEVADYDEINSGNGASASTTLPALAANISGNDSEFDSLTVSGSEVIGYNVTFVKTNASLVSTSGTATMVDGDTAKLADVNFVYALKAEGDSIYVSKTPGLAVATSSTAATSTLVLIDGGSQVAGDTDTYFLIPDGSSRTFTLSGSMNNTGGTAGTKEFKITGVKWTDDSANLVKYSITAGLDALRVTKTMK